MRGKAWLAAALVAAAALGLAAFSIYRRPAQQVQKKTPATATPAQTINLNGRIQPQHVVSVPAPADGTLDAVFVDAGQEVSAGQLLARVESSRLVASEMEAQQEAERAQSRVHELEGALESARLQVSSSSASTVRAQSRLDSTEKEYLRQEMLVHEGATPRLVFEKSEREYQAARTDLESVSAMAKQAEDRVQSLNRELQRARESLDQRSEEASSSKTDAEVHSPVDGVVIFRSGQPGEKVAPGKGDLFQIAVNLAALDVVLTPDPKALAWLPRGKTVMIRVAEAGDVVIPGVVREAGPGQALVGFQSPSPAIKPGLTALVSVAEPPRRQSGSVEDGQTKR